MKIPLRHPALLCLSIVLHEGWSKVDGLVMSPVDWMRCCTEPSDITHSYLEKINGFEKAWNQSLRAIENVGQVNPERPVVTEQNYEDTLAAAKARMAELKKKEGAEAVDY